MYACIHTNTYIYKYMNMYIYIYIYILIYTYKLAYVCMYRYTYIKKSVCIYVDILAIHWICYVHSTSTQKYQTSWKYCLLVPSFIGSDSWGVRSVILPHVRYQVPTQNCINQKSATHWRTPRDTHKTTPAQIVGVEASVAGIIFNYMWT